MTTGPSTRPQRAARPPWAGERVFSSRYRFVLWRVLWLVPLVGAVIVITFTLVHLAPGSPWDNSAIHGGRLNFSPAAAHNLEVKYGLDESWWRQLVRYAGNAARLDLGDSFQYQGHSVRSLIVSRLPQTTVLGVTAFLVIVPLGIGMGILAARRQNSPVDYLVTAFSTAGASVPNFVVGLFCILLLSVTLNRLTGGRFYLPDGGYGLDAHLVLPVITLSLLPIAFLARLTRASTLDALRQDFVRTARAKGVSEPAVLRRHVLKAALLPLVTALGPMFAYLITGSVVVETLFQIRGLGGSFVNAVSAHDYPMILGTTIVFAVVFAVANLVVDVAYVLIDPRVSVA